MLYYSLYVFRLSGAEGVHKVIGNLFHKNYGGSLRYSTVGEINPGIVLTGLLL